ncbi:MAG: sensor histidine kinase KdpD [Pseudomonadota bacterium]|nr:sensor histidine kinase KdpD [Pseudomonadota bacterium]
MSKPDRADPDALLRVSAQEGRGRLKVYLGAAPGVGKTYEMLSDAASRRDGGLDVVVGIVETHGRAGTEQKAQGFAVIPRQQIAWQGRTLTEMDLDGILARHPALVLVDELAHTNAPGSRHDKRYQDVEELLAAGIDVWSTVNIQHLESLNDVVASFTKVRVRETLPDRVLENAEIEIVDIPPDDLIERLKEGKVYIPQEATRALGHFFSKSNLSALRELTLRRAAQAVDAQMLDYVRAHALAGSWGVNDRLVVAVSEHPGSPALVRAAKRIADALHASWTAVHIETPRSASLGDAENAQLAATMHLAAQLGAQVAAVPGQSVVDGLVRFTQEARATQLILGKSRRSRWFEFRHGSVVDRMVRDTPGMAVHVLPLEQEPVAPGRTAREAVGQPGQNRGQNRGQKWGKPGGYALALALTALVTLFGISVSALGNITNIALLYLLPVLFAATRYGLRTGMTTGLVCSLAYNYFFIPPTYTFTIQDPQNIITVLVLMGVAIVSSSLAARMREQAVLAQQSAGQNASLAGFARLLTGVSKSDELGQVLCAEVARLLDARAVLLMPESREAADLLQLVAANPPEDRLQALEHAAARWAFDNNRPAGRGSDTLTASEWLFHPIAAAGKVLAVFGLARPEAPTPLRPDQLPMLLSLLDQAGMTLERIGLETDMAQVTRLEERDRLRGALLSSISHDLRTPLTTILGTLAAMHPATAEQGEQIAEARAEAERLHRFFANLLDIARVEAGALHQSVEPVDIAEAVASAVHDLRRALAGRAIRMDVSPELPFVLVDPQLFHHCLINLLENAAKYGDPSSPIVISAKRGWQGLELHVIDEGPGLPVGEEGRIFDIFTRIEGTDRTGGTGLGLGIVRGFAEAMGLRVGAANRSDRSGADFVIHFGEAHLKRAADI